MSSDLVPQEPIRSLHELYQRLLELQKGGAHIITPFMIQEIPAKHVPVLIPVPVDPDVAKGDVYPSGGGKFSLGRNPLRRIEQAMGIDWDLRPGMTGRVDNGSNPDYIHYKAVGYCPMPDGTKKTIVGEKEIRVELLMEEAVNKLREEARARQENSQTAAQFKRDYPTPEAIEARIQENARHEMLQIKKHLLARAATGAKSIAVKSLGVREGYTKDELAHPFIVLKLQARLDMNDPEDAALIRAQALGMVETLFSRRFELPSPAKETPALEYQASPESVSQPSVSLVAAPPLVAPMPTSAPAVPTSAPTMPTSAPSLPASVASQPSTAPSITPAATAQAKPTPPVKTEKPAGAFHADSLFEDFKALSVQEQAKELERMVKLADPARAGAYTAARIARWSDHARHGFYQEQTKKLAGQKVGAA